MIFHIPHALIHIPPGVFPKIALSKEQLTAELLKITDWFTDDLFGGHAESEDPVIVYPVSRLVVDPERFVDDDREAMAGVGMGVIYTKTSDGSALRAHPTSAERESLLANFYYPHHQRLSGAVELDLKRCGKAMIVDCHSFPSHPLPYEQCQKSDRPDICIGTDDFHTPDQLVRAVEDQCRAASWSFELNQPFSCTIVPMTHNRKTKAVSSIMIEINRRLYMDEKNGTKSKNYEMSRLRIGKIVSAVRGVHS